ncbi:tRNA (adenosine(37)-N6)-threonylcarbamoyltransferase complex dimerization subunit type 1 TsaB [Streptococcus loxodontisalivarius]|uniref:tRNA threonylcarbamoyl adenosine modification protein YeaZ n=1 Tax=Streptococcus loxodontisalivarius TaxID=1349415 RepID=A0ABS2PS46_9STRE|nr:tRNA (adenosine(37)-N6)-threonylcarbamoyltransferase complex dimerization subunit type 1 TsaB [Streptococcus loxodontisalivarius]MBM7642815.1 tRNA threonylcarbamoyl adenosine modification protein YeaZ [Streptococcus loxodontisalivarius]
MNILAFDTSSKALSVALFADETLLGEITINVKKNHSISLMPSIDYLVATCDLTPKDLDRIVVAQGPGSYTGLRVAVATAKTLAYALKIDLVGVSSLAALTDVAFDGLVVPVMDARRNNVYVGFYENGQSISPDRHASFESVLEEVKGREKVIFVGEVASFTQQIEEVMPHALIQETLPSAKLLVELGRNKDAEDVDAFLPNYLKRVEAEENWLKNNEATGQADYIKRV